MKMKQNLFQVVFRALGFGLFLMSCCTPLFAEDNDEFLLASFGLGWSHFKGFTPYERFETPAEQELSGVAYNLQIAWLSDPYRLGLTYVGQVELGILQWYEPLNSSDLIQIDAGIYRALRYGWFAGGVAPGYLKVIGPGERTLEPAKSKEDSESYSRPNYELREEFHGNLNVFAEVGLRYKKLLFMLRAEDTMIGWSTTKVVANLGLLL